MFADILSDKELTAGTVTAKGPYYYLVMTWNEPIENELDEEGKPKIKKKMKWIPTKISVKESGGKKRAKDLLLLVRVAFNKNNPDVPLHKLLSQDGSPSSGTVSSIENVPMAPIIPEDKGILFSDYMMEWLDDIKIRVELTTYAAYQRNVCNRIAPYFQEKEIYLKDLTAQDIHLFYKQMLKKGLKAETVIRYHSNIRKALVDAVSFSDIYKINSNVLVELKKPFKPEKETFIPSFYAIEELNEMFKAFSGSKIELVVRLTAFYGFRREEVLGLKWSAIDFNLDTISVSHTITQCSIDGKHMVVQKDRAKSPSSRRIMPLVENIKEILLEHKKNVEENKKLFGKSYTHKYNEYVCVTEDGNLLKPGYVTKNFVKVLERNGLRKIRFHDLRHSCASLLVSSGVPMKMIQEWLGHSNFSTTADRYSHLEHTQKFESAKALTNYWTKNEVEL